MLDVAMPENPLSGEYAAYDTLMIYEGVKVAIVWPSRTIRILKGRSGIVELRF